MIFYNTLSICILEPQAGPTHILQFRNQQWERALPRIEKMGLRLSVREQVATTEISVQASSHTLVIVYEKGVKREVKSYSSSQEGNTQLLSTSITGIKQPHYLGVNSQIMISVCTLV